MSKKGSLKVDLNRVHDILYALVEGDEVELHFADASKNYNVKKLTNAVVAFHKRVVGRFVCLIYEKAYGTEYLIMQNWDYNQKKTVIWCIVMSTITHAQRIEKKAKKVTSDMGQVYLGGGKLKTIEKEGGIGENIEE